MEIFKPERSLFELENVDKRTINTNSMTHIIPVESSRSPFDIVQQQSIESQQVIPVSGLTTLPIQGRRDSNQKRTNSQEGK